jgi:LacI family transcriptional regulator
MNDVAREANVALKTVSRFVNGETNINPAMAARIAQAIAKLGYRRNLAAASLRPGRTSKILGLITSDLANPYFSTLTRAVEQTAREHGYLLISASSEEDGSVHDRVIDRLMEHQVDGLITVPPRIPGRSWSEVTPPVPPLVFVDRPGAAGRGDTILADNAGGARDATRELIRRGGRQVVFLGDDLTLYTMSERLSGFRRACEEEGLYTGNDVVFSDAHSVDDAKSRVSDLLRDGSMDALFAANNRAAIGALRAFREIGTRVPLVSFDDFEAATLVDPAVSIVAQDVKRMGKIAAETAIARLAGDDADPQTIVLPTRLVLRGSER